MNSALLTEEDEELLQFVLPTGLKDDSGRECKRDQPSLWSAGWSVFMLILIDQGSFVIVCLMLLLCRSLLLVTSIMAAVTAVVAVSSASMALLLAGAGFGGSLLFRIVSRNF